MHLRLFLTVVAAVVSLNCFSSQITCNEKRTVRLHTADELASVSVAEKDSHRGEEQWSSLQLIQDSYTVIPHSFLTGDVPDDQKTAIYPRIKKMADGRYIMFWHGGRLGSRVWCSTSADLKNWETPVLLFKPETVVVDGVEDVRRYVNPDAVVLPDGEILAVVSFRATKHYRQGTGSGLVLIRSNDNGRTWSQAQEIYDGCNWEPYLLRLPDGRIQCYFTDAVPQSRNSGTSVIVSDDKGVSWSGKIRASRQYKYLYDGPNLDFTGVRVYTDQMPSFRVLNDGKTIFGFLEARLENPGSISGSTYMRMSAVYNDGLDWKDLGEDGTGPQRRQTNCIAGAAGYVSLFPSGEVVVSCNNERKFMLKLLDRDGNCPAGCGWDDGWMRPFPGKGYWGATEVDSPQTIVGAMHCDEGMQIARFWLNHRIDAERSSVRLDGNGMEWKTSQALYLSSADGDGTIVRAAHDGRNLYFLVETSMLSETHTLNLLIDNDNELTVTEMSIRLDGTGAEFVCGVKGVKAVSRQAASTDGHRGYVTEIRVPMSSLKTSAGDMLRIYAESVTDSGTTSFSLSDREHLDSWQRIRVVR